MAPRRGAPSSNTLSPQDPSTPSSPSNHAFPRSTSPSSGFTQFLARPVKWFNRSTSNPKLNAAAAEPRASTSSARKHKISRPTDPRPILDSYGGGAARSVLDLSSRPQNSLDISPFYPPSTPSSPTVASPSGLGDLRTMSRRAWSRSADDLGKVSSSDFAPPSPSFQEKIAEYRNRSNSSASLATPSSPTAGGDDINGRQPFPTIKTTISPSSSPPHTSNMNSVTISVSAPALDEPPMPHSSPPAHVHARSHSFTPKLSSRLAPRIVPPSPKRKNFGDIENREPERQSPGAMHTTRNAFPFGLGGSKPSPSDHSPSTPPPQSSHRSTTLLSPPTSDQSRFQDGTQDGGEAKRSSQIVYNSGFINRLADGPPHPHHGNMVLSKGWKPFKLEMKGSKLYFYKPPGDRATAAKELFPTELVLEDEEDVEGDAGAEEADTGLNGRHRKGKKEDNTLGRKRRAFWGRKTHPNLVLDGEGGIEKGSFEALVHEAVFATTFLIPEDSGEVPEGHKRETRHRGEWRDFSCSVLLCLPSLIGQSKFETEFLRCCEYLVSGSQDAEQDDERSRVAWLADEYLRYHGAPADLKAWEEWRKETLPGVPSALVQLPPSNPMPTSSSMQALYLPSPVGSPNIGTFSPRPDDATTLATIINGVNGRDAPSSPAKKASVEFQNLEKTLRHMPSSSASRPHWATALEQEGLSRDVLLVLDPFLVARSLTLFHRSALEQAPDNLTAQYILGSESQPNPSEIATTSVPYFASFFGSDDHPHWLTKLLLVQILGADTSSGYAATPQPLSPGRRSEDRLAQTSRTHSRSEVISAWIRVGEFCRMAGDECSWQAIVAAICSPPVARLEKAWKRVDSISLATVESWVRPAADGEYLGVKEPRLVPWGGDINYNVKEELGKARGSDSDETFQTLPMDKTKRMFEEFRTSFSLCPRKFNLEGEDVGDGVRRLVTYWRDMFTEGGGTGGLAAKFQRVEQFLSLSFAAEPRRKGLFSPYYWSRPSSAPPPQSSLLPLMFPDALPTISLVDRGEILRGRVDSDAADVHFLRAVDGRLQSDDRRAPRFDVDQERLHGLARLNRSGTVIPVYNGDLLLVVDCGSGGGESTPSSRPSSRAPSRPPSSAIDSPGFEKTIGRTPSIRVKPAASQGLERKSSVARRSSLPSLSNRRNHFTSEPSSDPPLRVVVQAGTLNSLVDILVHGLHNVSVSVADDNGEISLRERMTRELALDHADFVKVWWNVFRSFITPLVFFELLRKLYIQSQVQGQSPTTSEYVLVAGVRSEVLATIEEWLSIGGGAQDVLDDGQLLQAMQSFINTPADHAIHQSDALDDPAVQQAWTHLKERRRSLRRLFRASTMRPPPAHVSRNARGTAATHESRVRNLSTREPPDIDRVNVEELVDNLDGMACAAFSNVTEEDLFITSDLLEVQTADRTGWFLSRDILANDENVEIQSMYTHIQEIEPSPMISELSQDSVYRLLPPGIRSCVRAYTLLRKWIVSKIVAPRLGLRARQARMEILLRAIEVTRIRSMDSATSGGLADKPCVRSFVEAVLSSAIISPESRAHHRAWQNVAMTRGSHCDSLTSLLSRPVTESVALREPLTVDMGWLIERLLDIIATPDVVESANQESLSLVNFEKRRQLCSLINDTPSLLTSRRLIQQNDINRRGFERLNNIEREVFMLQYDLRGIKEEAQREGAQAPISGPTSTKKVARPFQKLVALQMEKIRRDKNLRIRLLKEKLNEQARNGKRDDMLNRAMRPRKPGTGIVQKQHRNKKSMSAFLQFMRPISSAFTDTHAPGLKRSASELDFTPSGKPSLVLSLIDARVAQFINTERSFTFQLDTEDGGHYLLQAMNKRDMMKWIDTVNRISNMAAKRRLTYLGNSPKPQLSDHIHSHSATASRDPLAVFGVELEFLLEREAGGQEIEPGTMPRIIEQCLDEVDSRGLTEVGIYRIAGAVSEINALKDAFNRGESPIDKSTDIHAVCDLIKSWFRVLPEPIFPAVSYHAVIEAMKLENLDDRLSNIRSVVQGLPQANFDLVKRVSEHLDRVTDFEEYNQMTAEALAIVFSPNLLRAPQNDFGMIIANMGYTHKLVKALITHFHVIFDDADPDADADQEDELDSPILEEDEDEDDGAETQLPFIPDFETLRLTPQHDSYIPT